MLLVLELTFLTTKLWLAYLITLVNSTIYPTLPASAGRDLGFSQNLNQLLNQQTQFFQSNQTKSFSFRLEQLKKLKRIIQFHKKDIIHALQTDLNKPIAEILTCELGLILKEINIALRHLKKWMKPKSVKTPFIPFLRSGKSKIIHDPYGIVLIIAPWNFPFLLAIQPLVGAIAAGNCVLIKPSEHALQTESTLIKLINHHFPKEYIQVIRADAHQTEELLSHKFDYIFFSGSSFIGKKIMMAAAKHLTPITLELGGKNPCIVDEDAHLEFAAKRIIWAKTLNAGQACVAPDYLYVHENCKNKLIEKMKSILQNFNQSSYSRIINQKHFLRLQNLLLNGRIITGGEANKESLSLSPTIIDEVSWHDPIMQEEIFGPILPILSFNNMDEVINTLKTKPKSLALYLFSNNEKNQQKILTGLSFGGGCINDCVVHLSNSNLPFGGVGDSGTGHYHGKFSFQTFSHQKAIFIKKRMSHLGYFYPPYTRLKNVMIKCILKMLKMN